MDMIKLLSSTAFRATGIALMFSAFVVGAFMLYKQADTAGTKIQNAIDKRIEETPKSLPAINMQDESSYEDLDGGTSDTHQLINFDEPLHIYVNNYKRLDIPVVN